MIRDRDVNVAKMNPPMHTTILNTVDLVESSTRHIGEYFMQTGVDIVIKQWVMTKGAESDGLGTP